MCARPVTLAVNFLIYTSHSIEKWACTERELSVHRECTVRQLNVHEACADCARSMRWMCTEHALNVHEACAERAWSVHRACIKPARSVHWTCMERVLFEIKTVDMFSWAVTLVAWAWQSSISTLVAVGQNFQHSIYWFPKLIVEQSFAMNVKNNEAGWHTSGCLQAQIWECAEMRVGVTLSC